LAGDLIIIYLSPSTPPPPPITPNPTTSPTFLLLSFQYSATASADLPFSALRSVVQPFRDEHDDTLGLVPPELATRTLVLVFAVLPTDNYALELKGKVISSNS
jgi:hypothetical protein